jgi:uncharacterized protein (UPF0276 family)
MTLTPNRALGVGIVFVPGLERLLERDPCVVDFVELEPEMFWDHPVRSDAEPTPNIADDVLQLGKPVLVHGVGFAVGGSRKPPAAHLAAIRDLVEHVGAPWASEHLSVNEVTSESSSFKTGFLLPPRQTACGASRAAQTIRATAEAVGVPFAVETGANYLKPRADELTDGAFIRQVVESADCGILLDLHNAYVSERAGRQTIDELMGELPLDRVWEIHVAGGFEYEGFWLDGHSGRMPETLVEAARKAIPRLPNLRAVTFELLPEFLPLFGPQGVAAELSRLRELWQLRRDATIRPDSRRAETAAVSERPSCPLLSDQHPPEEWEATLGRLVLGHPVEGSLAEELRADPGLEILRLLADQVRGGMVASALPLTLRLLVLTHGKGGAEALLERFWRRSTPSLFSGEEGLAFAEFVVPEFDSTPYLRDVVELETALIRARVDHISATVRTSHDPAELVEALRAGELPQRLPSGTYTLTVA